VISERINKRADLEKKFNGASLWRFLCALLAYIHFDGETTQLIKDLIFKKITSEKLALLQERQEEGSQPQESSTASRYKFIFTNVKYYYVCIIGLFQKIKLEVAKIFR
jgi:hypothetical protein